MEIRTGNENLNVNRAAVNRKKESGGSLYNLTDRFTPGQEQADVIDPRKAADILLSNRQAKVHVHWAFKADRAFSQPPVISPDNKNILASDHNTLYCIDRGGKQNWKYKMDSWSCAEPAWSNDGKGIFTYDEGNNLKCLDSVTSNLKWNAKFDRIHSNPVVGKDGTVFINTDEGSNDRSCNKIKWQLSAVDPDNGEVKWQKPLKFKASSPPAPCPDGSVLVMDNDDNLYKFDKDGNQVFFKESICPCEGRIGVDDSGNIYLAAKTKKLYAFNPDGDLKWTYNAGHRLRQPPAVSPDGSLYLSTFAGKSIQKLVPDGQGGMKKEWEYNTGGIQEPSPVLSPDGKTVYVPGFDQTFKAISPDKKVLWQEKFDCALANKPAVGSDGSVYGAFQDKKVYRFGTVLEMAREKDQGKEEGQPAGSTGSVEVEKEFVIIDGLKIPINND